MSKSMLKIKRERLDEEKQIKFKTWGLCPIDDSCPFLFAAYDPSLKVLRVESKYRKEHHQRFYQRDEENKIRTNKHGLPLSTYEEVDDNWFFFVLEEETDIKNFLNAICINPDEDIEVSIEEIVNAAPVENTLEEFPDKEEAVEETVTRENI